MAEWSRAIASGRWGWVSLGVALAALGAVVSPAVGQGKAPASGAKGASNRAAAPAVPPAAGEPIVARVNNQVISAKALADECVARKGAEVLETMVSKLLVQQACQEKGISVTAKEIDEEIGRTAERLKMTREQFLAVLKDKRDIPPERYMQDIVWPGLALKKLATPYVKVTEEDIQRGYEAYYGEKVKCRWITFEDLQVAKKVWNELRNSSKDGKCPLTEFEHQVGVYSTDSSSRAIGGQINPISHHTSPAFQELENAAFAMKEDGEISKIIQVGDTWVILYREGVIPPQNVKLADVRPQLEVEIYETKLRDQVARVFEEIKKNSTIENLITGDVSSPQKQTAAVDKSATPKPDAPRVGTTKDTAKKPGAPLRR
jgi:foldase protein PrsA